MIYPLPNKFSSEQVPEAPVYLYIPEYKGTVIRKVEAVESRVTTAQKRRSQNIFDNAAPARIANAVRTAGTSGVIDLIIQNENNEATKVGIWPQHLLSSNFGNEFGITITSGVSNQTFAQILSAINNQRVTVNMLQVEGEAVARGGFVMDIVKTDANGLPQTNRLNFLLNPFQFQVDIIQLQHTFILDFSTSLEFTLPGNSTLFLKLFQPAPAGGFSNFDNSAGFPDDDRFINPEMDPNPTTSRRELRQQIRADRRQTKLQAKNARKEAKLAARAARGYIVRSTDMLPGTNRVNAWMEQEFYKKAREEFSTEELNAIYRLSDNNYPKFEELVLNYDFNAFGNNLADFLE